MITLDCTRRFRDERNAYLGADVTIEDSVRNSAYGDRFPLHRVSWGTPDGRRHAALVEPVIKFRIRKRPWPLGEVSEPYEDGKETLARMRVLVRSTLCVNSGGNHK